MHAGQSQKELSVNEALLAADILLHPVIENVVATPPASPGSGLCWLVGTSASGAFAGQTDRIAAWSEGGWRFVAPRDGMRIFDRTAGADRLYVSGSWRLTATPASPSGGTVIDSEARSAVTAILAALRNAGLLS